MRVGFIGTGIMGAPMARNLARDGHAVTVWNRTGGKAATLIEDGIRIATSPEAVVIGADLLILMVSTGAVCDAILFGSGDGSGVAPGMSPGSTVVVMSSIPVDVARRQAARLAEHGVRYVDAPVSGGERGAIAATLTIMAGGDLEVVEAVRPVLERLGRLTRVGPVGCGQLAKLANQLIVGVTIGAVAEALILAGEGGADIGRVREALLGGFAESAVLRQHGERMATGDFQPGARAEVQLKDLRTAATAAESCGIALPFLTLAETLYARMCSGDRAQLDHAGLYLEIRDAMRAGRPIAGAAGK